MFLMFCIIVIAVILYQGLSRAELLGYTTIAFLFMGAANSQLAGAVWAIAIMWGIAAIVPAGKKRYKFIAPGVYQELK